MSKERLEERIREKMQIAGVGEATISAFLDAHRRVCSGERGMVPEEEIEPVESLPRLADLPEVSGDGISDLRRLRKSVV